MADPFDLNNTENKPIRDIAYEELKHSIITGELPPGYRIVETVYANKLHTMNHTKKHPFVKPTKG